MDSRKSPFDDASGKYLLQWLADAGGSGGGSSSVLGAGTTIDDATQLGLGNVYVTATPASSGVKLSNATAIGQSVVIFNGDATEALLLYPPSVTQQFGDETAGDPITIDAFTSSTVLRLSETLWILVASSSAS